MEFRLAAEGNTDGLRAWLRQHPDRINALSEGSQSTLLQTVISNSYPKNAVPAVMSQPHADTMRMLCEEFYADVSASGGGSRNTSVHLLAQMGDHHMLQYLLDNFRPSLSRNAFGEKPIQIAERVAAASTSKGATECVRLLQAYAARRPDGPEAAFGGQRPIGSKRSPAVASPEQNHLKPSPSIPVNMREEFKRLIVCDSDDDSATTGGECRDGLLVTKDRVALSTGTTPAASLARYAPPSQASQGPVSCASSVIYDTRTGDSAGSSALPRCVSVSPSYSAFTADVKAFCTTYGNGFTMTRGRKHVQLRGLLPYKYRSVEYFTPVIILLLPSCTPCVSNSGDGNECSSLLSPAVSSVTNTSVAPPRTYRALVDLERMSDLAINKQAVYIDPLSGSIIPSPGDPYFTDVVAFIRGAVTTNFEHIPPLIARGPNHRFSLRPLLSSLGTPAGDYQHTHGHRTPSYMANVLEKRDAAQLRTFRVLQDLSRLCDGAFNYDARSHNVTGRLPIFVERPKVVLLTTSVFLQPAETDISSSLSLLAGDPGSSSAAPGLRSCSDSVDRPANVEKQMVNETDLVLALRVRIDFVSGSGMYIVYDQPPRVYLLDAVAGTATCEASYSLTYRCFREIIADPLTGEVERRMMEPAIGEWKEKGSLYDVLEVLQKLLTRVLQKFAMAHNENASVTSYQFGVTANTSASPNRAPSPLDHLFGVTSSSSDAAARDNVCKLDKSSCVICMKQERAAVLQPCRHLFMCITCAKKCADGCRPKCFLCPVCHTPVSGICEVYW